MEILPGQILESPFWSEPVRVLSVQPLGTRLRLEAVGVRTQLFYSNVLSPEDLSRVRPVRADQRDFTGDPKAFFLAIEAHRIRFAHQFDPLLAIHVSQIDPLPHQIEAVYHYILISSAALGSASCWPMIRAPAKRSWPASFSKSSRPAAWSSARSSWSPATSGISGFAK